MRVCLFFSCSSACTSLGQSALFLDGAIPDAPPDATPKIDASPPPDAPPGTPDADPYAPDAPLPAPTLTEIQSAIIGPKCAAPCHSGAPADAAAGMVLSGNMYAIVVGVTAQGSKCKDKDFVRVVAGDPDSSLLMQKVRAKIAGTAPPCGDAMPKGSNMPALSEAEAQRGEDWIRAGAKND